ncbi:MAG: 50S ribosomal protein L2 [Acidobacteriota bacterium]|jgi:LSU ribosomal protein L2P|nr:50S ribosomal protein L2 [Acidobacteriota bacterium]OQB56035.1 MAG: 50S ribosomal protein L2 [Candidatus Aminicenantes bacterium ADurb.Bin147]HNQ79543.1 50S ribosomal protein L2 [Candidatus Aminicenantes bacterium]MDD8010109.1 50S ribosomal protein L2 [Acidobacteriota bacterium]MDD8029750.1 50S ribosomal protein L2 [Acidobacteriota bacterium]
MGIKSYRPISAGQRHKTGLAYEELTGDRPHKPLLESLPKKGGRDNRGRLTMRHRGGGNKTMYRLIDFRRDKLDVPGVVETVEYDPNRSSFISLIKYRDGERRYILTPLEMKVGQTIISSDRVVDVLPGNATLLRNIPLGTVIHNIEIHKDRGGQMCRTAGSGAQILAKEGAFAQVRLPSSEIRKIHLDCRAVIGQVGNLDHQNISVGKAGRSRWMGWRPHVRGTAMNPIDHPHGGGEGKAKGGRHPVSPTGIPTKGYKTRKNKRTQIFIVRRRSK